MDPQPDATIPAGLQTAADGVLLGVSRFVVSGDAPWRMRIAITRNGIPPHLCVAGSDACREGIPMSSNAFTLNRPAVR
jgi:hypothetical protein